MRRYPTDYWLWGLLFWPAFIGLGFLRDPFDPGSPSLWGGVYRWVARGGGPVHEGGLILIQTVTAIPLAFGIGWVAQAIAQLFGIRLKGQPDRSEFAHYDDKPPIPRSNSVPTH